MKIIDFLRDLIVGCLFGWTIVNYIIFDNEPSNMTILVILIGWIDSKYDKKID